MLGEIELGAERRRGNLRAFEPARFVYTLVDGTAERESHGDQRGQIGACQHGTRQPREQTGEPSAAGAAPCARSLLAGIVSLDQAFLLELRAERNPDTLGRVLLCGAPAASFAVNRFQIID